MADIILDLLGTLLIFSLGKEESRELKQLALPVPVIPNLKSCRHIPATVSLASASRHTHADVRAGGSLGVRRSDVNPSTNTHEKGIPGAPGGLSLLSLRALTSFPITISGL